MTAGVSQAANVHAVLEGGPMVASTVQRAGEAARAVDDLAETLAIFDLKLRHMRAVSASHLQSTLLHAVVIGDSKLPVLM